MVCEVIHSLGWFLASASRSISCTSSLAPLCILLLGEQKRCCCSFCRSQFIEYNDLREGWSFKETLKVLKIQVNNISYERFNPNSSPISNCKDVSNDEERDVVFYVLLKTIEDDVGELFKLVLVLRFEQNIMIHDQTNQTQVR